MLRDALLAVAENDAEVAKVAGRSSVHANGFAKIVLHVTGEDGRSARLHVWHRSNGRWVPDKPHGHRWKFASWIVVGTLRETTFVEMPGAVEYERFDYGRDPDGRPYLRESGCASLHSDMRFARPAGTVYTRDRSVIHTVDPQGDGLVASLVLQGPRRFEPTPVYVRPDAERDDSEWPLTRAAVRTLLYEVAEAIR